MDFFHDRDGEIVQGPHLGSGTAHFEYRPAGEGLVDFQTRCLGPESEVGLLLDGDAVFERDFCGHGHLGAQRDDDTYRVTIDADDETHWVFAVERADGP